jgi:hypothetical protein
MTVQELQEALGSGDAYEVIASLGDRFVSSILTDIKAFWEGDDVRRELYSVLAVLHHANANGLQALIDYNEDLWVPVTAYASKMIDDLQATDLKDAIIHFEELIASNLSPSPGARLPRNADQLKELQEAATNQGLEWVERVDFELSQMSEAFVGCADGDFPEKLVAWMKVNAEEIAPLIG